MSLSTKPFQDQLDPVLMVSRRAFPLAQQLLAGGVAEIAHRAARVIWYGSATFPEIGACAIVQEETEMEELVGEVLRCSTAIQGIEQWVYVYCVGALPLLDVELGLSRRAFLELAPLSTEVLEPVVVEVVAS